jgi:hypothetical protein
MEPACSRKTFRPIAVPLYGFTIFFMCEFMHHVGYVIRYVAEQTKCNRCLCRVRSIHRKAGHSVEVPCFLETTFMCLILKRVLRTQMGCEDTDRYCGVTVLQTSGTAQVAVRRRIARGPGSIPAHVLLVVNRCGTGPCLTPSAPVFLCY